MVAAFWTKSPTGQQNAHHARVQLKGTNHQPYGYADLDSNRCRMILTTFSFSQADVAVELVRMEQTTGVHYQAMKSERWNNGCRFLVEYHPCHQSAFPHLQSYLQSQFDTLKAHPNTFPNEVCRVVAEWPDQQEVETYWHFFRMMCWEEIDMFDMVSTHTSQNREQFQASFFAKEWIDHEFIANTVVSHLPTSAEVTVSSGMCKPERQYMNFPIGQLGM